MELTFGMGSRSPLCTTMPRTTTRSFLVVFRCSLFAPAGRPPRVVEPIAETRTDRILSRRRLFDERSAPPPSFARSQPVFHRSSRRSGETSPTTTEQVEQATENCGLRLPQHASKRSGDAHRRGDVRRGGLHPHEAASEIQPSVQRLLTRLSDGNKTEQSSGVIVGSTPVVEKRYAAYFCYCQ